MAAVAGTTDEAATRASTDELVGREPELALLERFLDDLSVGPDAVLAVGEAGIGKTTLWDEMVRRATARGYRVLLARGRRLRLRCCGGRRAGHASINGLFRSQPSAHFDRSRLADQSSPRSTTSSGPIRQPLVCSATSSVGSRTSGSAYWPR